MHVPFARPVVPLALVALVSWFLVPAPNALSQEEAGADAPVQEPSAPENPVLRLKRLQRERRAADLTGAWDLYSFRNGDEAVPKDEIVGSAVFCDGFMGLVIHAIGLDDEDQTEIEMAQAGIYRFSVDDSWNLQTLTVIGHSSPRGEIRYEPIGGLREYRLQVDPTRLRIHHRSGTELVFLRAQPVGLSGQEIARLLGDRRREREAGEPELEAPEGVASEAVESEGTTEEEPVLFESEFERQKREREALEEALRGSWHLTGYAEQGIEVASEDLSGSALFCDGTMSLVIHAIEYGDEFTDEYQFAQAGIFQYRIAGADLLQTSTLLAHANPYDGVDYEAPGGLRQYRASVEDRTLTLDSGDGVQLLFQRMNPREFTDYEKRLFNRYGRGDHLIDDDVTDEVYEDY